MALSCAAQITLHLMTAQPQATNSAAIAESKLRACEGIVFSDHSLLGLFLETEEDADRMDKGQLHVFIRDSKKLGRQNLKYLRDLPNLKEVEVYSDFPDDWCQDLMPLTQIEGLYFCGDRSDKHVLTDRGIAVVAHLPNLKALTGSSLGNEPFG